MPTINLNDDNQVKQSDNVIDDSWDTPWIRPQTTNQQGSKKQTPQERVAMIEKIYEEILGRKPDTRDINYYKYSTLGENEIRQQLLTGKEHRQLLEDGRDYKKLKERTVQAETRVKMLEGQIKDQIEEFKELTNLLKEKNKYILDLREKINIQNDTNPFSNSLPPKQIPKINIEEKKREEKFVDRVRKTLKSLA